LAAYIYLQRP